jgi:hypothetical protein
LLYSCEQVTPVATAGRPQSELIPAHIPEFTRMAISQVSVVLDGVRDAVSGLTESIECSQATISAYQEVVLEEKHSVKILGERLPASQEPSNSAMISVHSTSTDGDQLREPPDADTGSPHASRSYPQHRISSATVHNRAGSVISLTSSSIDEDMIADGSGSESSGSSVTPKSMEEDGDSDSMVSSDGLTNTSDEEE